jgi:hypothetical protein
MTSKKVSIRKFLAANTMIQGALFFGIASASLAGYLILIGFMTSSNSQHNEDIFFLFKYLLRFSNGLLLFIYILCISMGLHVLYESYQEYDRTHKSYSVTGFKDMITREYIFSQKNNDEVIIDISDKKTEIA